MFKRLKFFHSKCVDKIPKKIMSFGVLGSAILGAIISSSLPVPKILEDYFWITFFYELKSGNAAVLSLSLSVIAAYIFYFVDIYIPGRKNRKLVVETITPQISQLLYRTMCLIYLHKELGDKVSKTALGKIYSLINVDIKAKCNFIFTFSSYLNLEEVKSINSILSQTRKFSMFHRKLDEISEELFSDIRYLYYSYDMPSPLDKDELWLVDQGGKLSLHKDSDIFKLFIGELISQDSEQEFINIDEVGGQYKILRQEKLGILNELNEELLKYLNRV